MSASGQPCGLAVLFLPSALSVDRFADRALLSALLGLIPQSPACYVLLALSNEFASYLLLLLLLLLLFSQDPLQLLGLDLVEMLVFLRPRKSLLDHCRQEKKLRGSVGTFWLR